MTAEDKPLTSVVMVSYNTGRVLFEAIRSVFAQTMPVELLLVDNGNPTETLKELQAIAEKDPRLTLISGHGNVGFGSGCNVGAKAAKGDFILLLNPDGILPAGVLEKLYNYSSYLKHPFMIGARLQDENGIDQRGCRRALLTPSSAFIEALHLGFLFPNARLNFNDEPVPNKLAVIPAISGAFMFLPREDYWKIDGYDERYFLHVEDLDFCWRFSKAGGMTYFAPDIVVTHIGGTSKVTKAFIEKCKARGFVRYFHQNFGNEYPAPFLWLLDLAIWARAYLKIIIT